MVKIILKQILAGIRDIYTMCIYVSAGKLYSNKLDTLKKKKIIRKLLYRDILPAHLNLVDSNIVVSLETIPHLIFYIVNVKASIHAF